MGMEGGGKSQRKWDFQPFKRARVLFKSMSAVGDLLDAIRNDASHTVREVIARKKVDLSGDIEPVGTPLFFAASLGHTNSVNVTYQCVG